MKYRLMQSRRGPWGDLGGKWSVVLGLYISIYLWTDLCVGVICVLLIIQEAIELTTKLWSICTVCIWKKLQDDDPYTMLYFFYLYEMGRLLLVAMFKFCIAILQVYFIWFIDSKKLGNTTYTTEIDRTHKLYQKLVFI